MQEFTTVSASFYDPAALAAKLTEKSADGWSVVGIVSTGGDVTAFMSRPSNGVSTPAPATMAAMSPEPEPVVSTPDPMPAAAPMPETAAYVTPEPAAYTPEPAPAPAPTPAAEPAGWAVAPEPAPAPAPAPEPEPTYTPAPAAAAAPAVPAGWYADPAGRFELRYWDGSTWTEHVSRAGQQYTDPPVA